MPSFSLLTPMPGLPWYLLSIWPLIFWRIQRLKRWFKATGSPGSQMLWGVMWNGRVVIIQLSGEEVLSPLVRSPRRKPGPRATQAGLAARDPGVRREEREFGPIPDT